MFYLWIVFLAISSTVVVSIQAGIIDDLKIIFLIVCCDACLSVSSSLPLSLPPLSLLCTHLLSLNPCLYVCNFQGDQRHSNQRWVPPGPRSKVSSLLWRRHMCCSMGHDEQVSDWSVAVCFWLFSILLFPFTLLVVVLAFSLLQRIWGECSTSHSLPGFFFFFLKWRLARAH